VVNTRRTTSFQRYFTHLWYVMFASLRITLLLCTLMVKHEHLLTIFIVHYDILEGCAVEWVQRSKHKGIVSLFGMHILCRRGTHFLLSL
jgi:hypothetical protein